MKLRGIVSQAYIAPIDTVPILSQAGFQYAPNFQSLDLSTLLGVTKYEAPVNPCVKLSGDMDEVNLFTLGLVPKTEEVRVESEPWLFGAVTQGEWYVTQKIEGTSATFANYQGRARVAGRNHFLKDTENSYYRFASRVGLLSKLEALGDRQVAIQGELAGPKINGNLLKLKQLCLFVFRVWDIDSGHPMEFSEAREFVSGLDLEWAPVLLEPGKHEVTLEELTQLARA